MDTRHAVTTTRLGEITLMAEGDALVGLYFPHHWYRPSQAAFGPGVRPSADPLLSEAAAQLDEYLPGERIVAGDAEPILRVGRVVLGVHDAGDAWSETFLAAMRAYPDLSDDANVEAWLVTIAHRKAIDIARARKRHAVLVGEVPETA